MKKNIFLDPLSRNIAYLSWLVFVLALQVLIILVFIYQFIPLHMDPITKGVPQALLKLFQPNRNQFFYHAFIAAAIMGQILGLYLCRKRLAHPALAKEIRAILIPACLLVSWQLFAVFKILQYENPSWARYLLYAGFAAALLTMVFWPELKRMTKTLQVRLQDEIPVTWKYIADGGVIVVLLLGLLIPDIEKAVVRLAMADNNNHFDQWLMAPVWAFHQGLIPALQFFNPLNWGVVVFVHALVSILGGVTYGHALTVLCFLAVLYYAAFYYFFRYWLGIGAAAFGVLLAVKLQMFHLGINPLIWVYPAQTVLRHIMDVPVFFCLLCYARGRGEVLLWSAAGLTGVALASVFDTGVFMLAALYAYVATFLLFKGTCSRLCPSTESWRKILGLAVVPWFVMVVVLMMCLGAAVLQREFWTASFKDIPGWLNGVGAVSIFSCLKDRNFFAFFAAFAPPLIYASGAAIVIRRVWDGRLAYENLFIVPLSVYGLGVYAHFLWHSTINEYYMVPLPLVGCICFWATQYLNGFSKTRQRVVKFIFVVLAGIGLGTNFLFTYYPNVLNMAAENWGELKAYGRANFNFNSDSNFVGHWSEAGQPVALISGFETQILMQANRKPFFYNSMTLMDGAGIQGLVQQLDKDNGRPGQVFIDKNILGTAGLEILTDHLKNNYQYTGQQSDHLVLLKRDHA